MKRSREFQWLASQARPFYRLHVASYFCILISSGLVLLDPLIVRLLIDDVIPRRRIGWLPLVGVAFFLSYIGRMGFDGLAGILNFRAVQKMAFSSRLKLLCHLQRLSAEYHDNTPVGDTLHRLQLDVDQASGLSGEVIPAALRILTVFCLVMAAMLALNFRLTLIVLPLIPLFILVRQLFYQHLIKASDEVQQHSSRVIGFLEEHLSAIVQVQLLSCEQREARRFASISSGAVRAQMKRRVSEVFFSSLLYLIIVLGMTGVLCYGGYQVVSGSLTAGGLVAFYGYTLQLFMPLYGVVDIYSKFQRAAASVRRLIEVMEAKQVLHDHPRAQTLAANVPAIDLKEVFFDYSADRKVLAGVDLRINPGERVALAGTSGNGKSTLAKLMVRLYDVRSGGVLVDGTDVRDIKLKSLRSCVIFVPQDPVLFNVTLRENLLFGNPRATRAELATVTKLVQLEPLINRLPNGLDEPLGPRGNRLSGGERQRVALARALLQRPKILILDECTSALDEPTEKLLLTELDGFLRNVTTVIISHRPFPTRWADRVVYMDLGEIAAPLYQSDLAMTPAWDTKKNLVV